MAVGRVGAVERSSAPPYARNYDPAHPRLYDGSGPAWGWFYPVTPWARVKLGSNATDVASFAFVPLTAR